MDPFRKYIITQIIKQTGKIPRTTSLIDNAVSQLKIRLKNAGENISKYTDPKQITQFFNKEKSYWNQQVQQSIKEGVRGGGKPGDTVFGLKDYATAGWSDTKKRIIELEEKLGRLNASLPGFRERAKPLVDELENLQKRLKNVVKGPFEGFKPKVVPKPKDIKSKLDKQNKESIQRFKDKMKNPEDLAGGGIAGMLGERMGYDNGKIVKRKNEEMGPLFETNDPQEAFKEVIQRLINIDPAKIPLTDKLQLMFDLNRIKAGGSTDLFGGELNFGYNKNFGREGEGFGFEWKKQFAGGGIANMLGEPTYQDDNHRVPLSWGGWLMRLLQGGSKAKPFNVKDFVDKREFILSLIGQSSKQKNKKILAEMLEESEKIRKNPKFKFPDTGPGSDFKNEIEMILSKNITKHADGGRVPLKKGKTPWKAPQPDENILEGIWKNMGPWQKVLWGLGLSPFEKGGRVGLQGGGIPGALLAALKLLMQKYGKDVIKLAKDVKPSKKWDTQKAIQGFLERNPQFKNKITSHAGDAPKAGEGKFTKAEVLLEMFKNTIKQSKSADTKKRFTNFSKEIQNKPELANDSKVWNFFTKGLPKDQKLTVYADDTVDFWRQSKFGPHNIKTTDKFMKKHPYLTRDQAVKIQNMQPEDQILEMKRLETIRNKKITKAIGTGEDLSLTSPTYAEKYTKQLLKDHKLEKGRKPNAIGGRVSLSSGGVAGMLGE